MKFTRSRVKVCLYGKGNEVYLTVSDDGAGMDESTLKKIWDRLYQADASRSRKLNAGLGLGLSFVAAAAKLLDCRAYAESTPGVGSTFYPVSYTHLHPFGDFSRKIDMDLGPDISIDSSKALLPILSRRFIEGPGNILGIDWWQGHKNWADPVLFTFFLDGGKVGNDIIWIHASPQKMCIRDRSRGPHHQGTRPMVPDKPRL